MEKFIVQVLSEMICGILGHISVKKMTIMLQFAMRS